MIDSNKFINNLNPTDISNYNCTCNIHYGKRSMFERETGICKMCEKYFSNYGKD